MGVLDDPKDGEVDVDDVLVAGQHQRLFGHLAADLAAARALGVAIADLGPVVAGHARPQHRLDRGRQVIVETWLGRPIIGAKPQNDPDLIGQNAVEPARQPMTTMPSTTMAMPVPVPKPPGDSGESGPGRALGGLEVGEVSDPAREGSGSTATGVAAQVRRRAAAAPWATALTFQDIDPEPFRISPPGFRLGRLFLGAPDGCDARDARP